VLILKKATVGFPYPQYITAILIHSEEVIDPAIDAEPGMPLIIDYALR
jgi:hypothetical protein